MESGADLDESGDAPAREHAAVVGLEHTRDELQRRRLARAVEAEDGDRLAFAHLEAQVVERGEHRPARTFLPLIQPMKASLNECGVALDGTAFVTWSTMIDGVVRRLGDDALSITGPGRRCARSGGR